MWCLYRLPRTPILQPSIARVYLFKSHPAQFRAETNDVLIATDMIKLEKGC